MKTKLFTLLLAVAASIGTMFAAIVNGTCGDNLTWSLNTKDSTLIITGTGEMWDWNSEPYAPWNEYSTYIAYVNLPNDLTSIGARAFYGCNNLTSIAIPNNVTSIGARAFLSCSSLTSISIPNSVTSIGNSAFFRCTGLTSITIPNSVKKIGSKVFCECSGLASVIIEYNVTSIGSYTFMDCSSLTSINIPTSVTSIGEQAFYGCNIHEIYTDNLTGWCNKTWSPMSDDYDLYIGKEKVIDLVIPSDITSVGDDVFSGCTSLNSVIIPNSVTSIGSRAFSGCNLISITCENTTPPSISSSTFSNYSAVLFVPKTSISTYQNTILWEEFAKIFAIGTIIGTYRVEFRDTDDTILKVDSVNYGSAALAPENPSHEGHEFVGWDKDFCHVTSDMTIKAQYAVNYYPVIFLNADGSLLSEQSVAYNTSAKAPYVPTRDGYTFIGWTADIEHIKARTFAIALYEQNAGINITYKSEDGNIISSEKVDMHLPVVPIIAGKSFKGWLAESADSENGIVLRATYTVDNPTTNDDVIVTPTSNSAEVTFPYVTDAMTYELVVRDLSDNVVCKIMFDASGRLSGIAFAPGRNNAPQKTQSTGFYFTVEGLSSNTTYKYVFTAYDKKDQVIETLLGSFSTTAGGTGVKNISSASAPHKIMTNSQILILRGDRTYTLTGQEVK